MTSQAVLANDRPSWQDLCDVIARDVEPKPEPPEPAHFARSRQKRGDSGSERDVKLSKISKRELKAFYLQDSMT